MIRKIDQRDFNQSDHLIIYQVDEMEEITGVFRKILKTDYDFNYELYDDADVGLKSFYGSYSKEMLQTNFGYIFPVGRGTGISAMVRTEDYYIYVSAGASHDFEYEDKILFRTDIKGMELENLFDKTYRIKVNKMLITTTEFVDGQKLKLLGVVSGSSVQMINEAHGIGLKRKNPGNDELNEMLRNAKDLATKQMIQKAKEMYADVIVCAKYNSSLMKNTVGVMAYGTAAKYQ